ncbi:MAG: DUF6178 family protein [Caldimicrobium sp.]|nr:DUF6178 family protein [Caldimicrobium sp.]MCX7874374.1 DUF6178 family protein [Caldimicrobium sp.]MDW8093500.1 DUF6178 family protein [Caldimicrobium sp.]
MSLPFLSKDSSLFTFIERLLSLSEKELEGELRPLRYEELFELVLRTPWEKRAKLILLSPYPAGIIRNLPLIEFFLTLKASSLEETVEMLSYAKASQIQFLFDFDAWFKDRLKPERILSWLILIYEAGEDLLKRWLEVADWDFLIAMMQKFIRVHKRPDDVDLLEARDYLPPYTLDDFYFIEFKDERVEFYFRRIIEIIREEWPEMYFSLMESLIWELPAEVEERALRFRNGRLADEGIPDYYTALEVYTYIHPKNLSIIQRELLPIEEEALEETFQIIPFEGSKDLIIFKVLEKIKDPQTQERLQRELAWLATKVTLVDFPVIDGVEEVKRGILKMWAGLNLGLEYLAEEDLERAKYLLETHYLEEIFRVSRTALRELRKFALSLLKSKEFNPILLKYLDQPYDGYLKGATAKNLNEVKLFNPGMLGTSEEYIEFSRVSELRMVRRYLEEVAYMAPLLERALGPFTECIKEILKPSRNFDLSVLTWSSLIITALANYVYKGEFVFKAVPQAKWKEVLIKLLDGDGERTFLRLSLKEELFQNFRRLAQTSYYVEEELLRSFLDFVVLKFDNEFKYIDIHDPPEPKYQTLILIEL